MAYEKRGFSAYESLPADKRVTVMHRALKTGPTPSAFPMVTRRELLPLWLSLLDRLAVAKPGHTFVSAGGHNFRAVRGYEAKFKSTRNPRFLSNHSWATAVDLDAGTNPMGKTNRTFPAETGLIANTLGFVWGAGWSRPDPMHLEFNADLADVVRYLKAIAQPKWGDVLFIGHTGDAVRALQSTLGGLEVDGGFGPATKARVKAFQAQHGLAQDAMVGRRTYDTLGHPVAASKASQVPEVQREQVAAPPPWLDAMPGDVDVLQRCTAHDLTPLVERLKAVARHDLDASPVLEGLPERVLLVDGEPGFLRIASDVYNRRRTLGMGADAEPGTVRWSFENNADLLADLVASRREPTLPPEALA